MNQVSKFNKCGYWRKGKGERGKECCIFRLPFSARFLSDFGLSCWRFFKEVKIPRANASITNTIHMRFLRIDSVARDEPAYFL